MPGDRPETERVAVPPDRLPVPRTVDPSRKLTKPVAEVGATPAVRSTFPPKAEGLGAEVRLQVVGEPTRIWIRTEIAPWVRLVVTTSSDPSWLRSPIAAE